MRRVLEEELGDSILEEYITLESEHEALQGRLQEERQELGVERALRSGLEERFHREQLAELRAELKEANQRAGKMDAAARLAIAGKQL
eukprot:g33225.t1